MFENKKREIIKISKKMKFFGFLPGFSGNISFRQGDKILITPSGRDKSELNVKDISILGLNGGLISGPNPSSEYRLHIAVYKNRKDIKAVIHTHPPAISALSCAILKEFKPLLAEFIIFLGKLPVIPYNTPGSIELANSVQRYLKETNAIILRNHGLLCFAKNLSLAAALTEEAEHFAKVYMLSLMTGNVLPIPKRKIKKLLEIRNNLKKAGIF